MDQTDTKIKKLSEINTGTIVKIEQFLEEELQIKLMEMGFIIGEEIVVNQKAPQGSPICITVCNYQLSLRVEEADKILVKCPLSQ